ncbi:CMRF35-like molecule 8 [Notothenia coriiceps]|uniref:CMRF35-like molecule 8 n=1 Tax=Notothenia coriiceps TaxID=8208 RepID=A0A6I9PII5_9TELE|nr:PREDICTED: CMRF35-like molecule 8 [Notothenia coriiceps]
MGMFTLTETESGFTVSISNVSPQHAGVYWCGVESTEGSYRAALRKIQLEVKAAITSFSRSPTIGQNVTYWCQYPEGAPVKKFICKGEDPSICEHVVSTAQNTERFSMIDETEKRNITITVRGVTKEDSGTYWCGAERKTETQSNPFFNRFLMTVVSVQPPTATFPVSSTTTAFAESRDGPHVVITVIICVAALLLLLFVLMLILIYTRFSKNKRDAAAAAQNDKDDYIYEEIQERPLKPDSGNSINKIYSTANFPTTPSASLHYSTINFRNGSGEAAEVLMTNPSSSACDYSAVKGVEIPTYSNVNQHSPEDPLYSIVSKTQQQ